MSHSDITYKDCQELTREQLKVFFNYIIDHITIKETKLFNEPIIYLVITIHLKLDGYAPKYTLDYLKNLNTGAEEKGNKKTTDSFFKNQLSNGGGEGVYLPKGNFIFNIEDIKELLLFRSMEIEDLLLENSIYI